VPRAPTTASWADRRIVVVVVMWFVVHVLAPSVDVAAHNVVAPVVMFAVIVGFAMTVLPDVVPQISILRSVRYLEH
jgi:hypothetical protein